MNSCGSARRRAASIARTRASSSISEATRRLASSRSRRRSRSSPSRLFSSSARSRSSAASTARATCFATSARSPSSAAAGAPSRRLAKPIAPRRARGVVSGKNQAEATSRARRIRVLSAKRVSVAVDRIRTGSCVRRTWPLTVPSTGMSPGGSIAGCRPAFPRKWRRMRSRPASWRTTSTKSEAAIGWSLVASSSMSSATLRWATMAPIRSKSAVAASRMLLILRPGEGRGQAAMPAGRHSLPRGKHLPARRRARPRRSRRPRPASPVFPHGLGFAL